MANKLKGQVKLQLGSKEYRARLTIDAIINIEDSLDMGIVKIATRMSEGDVRMSQVVNILTPALRGGGNDVQPKDVIKLISEVGIVPATAAVAQLLMEVLTHQQSEDSEEKKPKKEE